ncbi:hypothetical protein niasHT_031794 [Heterodera trifolii]|uniref:Ubiquitin-like domain-containing protein n=1 Tax=Heterodera trifolii TaxID=157864 RepID=A0ABD2IPI3_9BILA
MKQFCLSLFPVGISAGLMTMLLLMMIMPSTTDGIKIIVKADEHIFKKMLPIKTNIITVEVNGMEKVEDLKKKIIAEMEKESKTKYGSDFKRLTLKHGENDEILNDEKRIDHYPIENGDTVRLSIGEFQIFVQYKIGNEVKTYNVWVKSEETVAILKKKIQNESRFEPDDQILSCNSENDQEMEDEKTLTDYGIGNGTTIFMRSKFAILVKFKKENKESQYTVWVYGTDTVGILKKKIMAKMHNEFKIGFYSIGLSCSPTDKANDRLNDDSKTMKQYGINEGKVIYILHAFEERPGWDKTKGESRFELVYYYKV